MDFEIARLHFLRDVSPLSSLLKVLMQFDEPNVHYQGEGEGGFMSDNTCKYKHKRCKYSLYNVLYWKEPPERGTF